MRLRVAIDAFLVTFVAIFAVSLNFITAAPTSALDTIINSHDSNCGTGKPLCYAYKKSQGGGLMWIWIPTTYISFSNQEWNVFKYSQYTNSSAWYPSFSSGSVDCRGSGADGMFVLGAAWHWSGTSDRTGYFFPAATEKTLSAVNYPDDYLSDISKDYGDGSYTWNGSLDELHELYVEWQMADYDINRGDAETRWSQGNFNAFCGNPTPPSQFQSKTNAYYDAANSTGVKSFNTRLVSSEWKDGETSAAIEISVEAGGKVAIDFNSYLKTTKKEGGDTQYKVEHMYNCQYQFCQNFNNPSFIPEWTDFHVDDDKDDHSAITYVGKDTHYFFEIPQDAPAGNTYTFCEKITYKKSGKEDTKTGWTQACVKITIDDASAVQGKSQVSSGGDSKDSGWGIANTAPTLSRSIKSPSSGTTSVTVNFNHFLRSLSATPRSTEWEISRTTLTQTGSGISVTSQPNPLTASGVLQTSDTAEHGVGGTRTYLLTISGGLTRIASITICETLKFKTSPNKPTKDGWTKACFELTVTPASVVGDCPVDGSVAPDPGDDAKGSNVVYSGVANHSVSAFSSYAEMAYAKPTDDLQFAHCYFAEAQEVMYRNPPAHPDCEGQLGCGSKYDYGKDDYVAKVNSFRISTENAKQRNGDTNLGSHSVVNTSETYYSFSSTNGACSGNGSFTCSPTNANLSTVVYSHSVSDSARVKIGSAGGMIKQTIDSQYDTNLDNWGIHTTWMRTTTGCGCTLCTNGNGCCARPDPCYSSHGYYQGKAGGPIQDYAWAYVPFNFKTNLGTTLKSLNASGGRESVVLADGEVEVSGWVQMRPKSNGVTSGYYATEPPEDTKLQVVSFFIKDGQTVPTGNDNVPIRSNICEYFGNSVNQCTKVNFFDRYSSRSTWMSYAPQTDGRDIYQLATTKIAVPNIPVGYKFCTAIGISHADSGSDTNGYTSLYGNVTVNDNWHVSGATCLSVANRPSLQIWGGGTYTNGNIVTGLNRKATIDRLFGSWDEFALIVGQSGSIQGMSSGAALGYDSAYTESGIRPGGTDNIPLYRHRSPISLATVSGNSQTGTVEKSDIPASGDSLKTRLISRYITSAHSSATYPNTGDLSSPGYYTTTYSENYIANPYRLTIINGNATIRASQELGQNTTHIVHVKGNLTITSNVLINKGTRQPYTDIYGIPQYVFIVEGTEVNISANAAEINAWIIAPNAKLNTCYGYNPESGNRANTTSCGAQLVINGPIVVNSVTPYRTAGAGAQESSYLAHYHQGTSGPAVTWNDAWNADPAEIYNLTLASYLWAYAQATKFSQNNTVYTRELAPRL